MLLTLRVKIDVDEKSFWPDQRHFQPLSIKTHANLISFILDNSRTVNCVYPNGRRLRGQVTSMWIYAWWSYRFRRITTPAAKCQQVAPESAFSAEPLWCPHPVRKTQDWPSYLFCPFITFWAGVESLTLDACVWLLMIFMFPPGPIPSESAINHSDCYIHT